MIDVLIVGGIFREILDGDTKPRIRYGGSGMAAAVAAGRLGVRAALLSYVGSDDDVAVRAELRLAGVDDSYVFTVPGASGTFVFPSFESPTRPWPMYRPAESVPSSLVVTLPTIKVVVAFGIPDFDPIAAGWLSSLETSTTLIWDRQGWLSRARDSLGVRDLSPRRKIYIANELEAMDECRALALDDLWDLLPPVGFDAAVVKRGKQGVVVSEHSITEVHHTSIPAFIVETKSTIGTGDVFAGAFAARLASGDESVEAARWGCAAASIALTTGANLLADDSLEKIRHLTHPSRWGRSNG